MNFKIRGVQEADFPQIIALFQEFSVFEKAPDKMVNSLERLQKEKDYFNCFVVETEKQEIIGYVAYFFCYFTWSGKSLWMDDLYIKPAYRGHGLGSQLVQKMINFGKENGCHKLRWQVSNWNYPAIEFYKKLGAEISPEEDNCDLYLD